MEKLRPQLGYDRIEFVRSGYDFGVGDEIVNPLDIVFSQFFVGVVFDDQSHNERTHGYRSGSKKQKPRIWDRGFRSRLRIRSEVRNSSLGARKTQACA